MAIKNLDKAVERVIAAAKNQEKIIIYGDSDMDGAISTLILKEVFEYLNSFYLEEENLKVYFPDRESEGYGINKKALQKLASFAPALFFSLDCGVTNIAEIELAKQMGFEVVVIDHHQIIDRAPDALVVDPHQPGDEHPFKQFANAGLVLRLAQLIVKDEQILKDFGALAALASIGDKVPEAGENKEIIEVGMSNLDAIHRIGYQMLCDSQDFRNKNRDELGQKIINPLNRASHINNINQSFLLLTSKDQNVCQKICQKLIEESQKKLEEKRKVTDQVNQRIINRDGQVDEAIFEGDKYWDLIALGSAASDLVNKYNKPVFLFKIGSEESIGSARLPSKANGVKALESCQQYLTTYGGHPPACGFRFKNENMEQVGKGLLEYFKNNPIEKNE